MKDELEMVWPELVAVFQTCLERSVESKTPCQGNNTYLQNSKQWLQAFDLKNVAKKCVLQCRTSDLRDVTDRHGETSSYKSNCGLISKHAITRK